MARRRFAAVSRGWLAAARGGRPRPRAPEPPRRRAGMGAALVVAALLAMSLAGCGGDARTLEASTTPLEPGTTVGAQRYLADSAGAAAAVRDFARVLSGVPDPATPAALQRAGERLREPLTRAQRLSARLSAARLADQRLEGQRARVAPALAGAVTAMRRLTEAAEAGEAPAAARAADALRARIAALRADAGGVPAG